MCSGMRIMDPTWNDSGGSCRAIRGLCYVQYATGLHGFLQLEILLLN